MSPSLKVISAATPVASDYPTGAAASEGDKPYEVTVESAALAEALVLAGKQVAGEATCLNIDMPTSDKAGQAVTSPGGNRIQRRIASPFHHIQRSEKAITVDGDLSDWPQLKHVVRKPFVGFGKESWQGWKTVGIPLISEFRATNYSGRYRSSTRK